MNFLADILLLAVVILFVIIGKTRGFLRTLLSFLGKIVSIVTALFVSKTYSEKFYELFLKTRVTESLKQRLEADGGGAFDIAEVMKDIPASLLEFCDMLGFDVDSLMNGINSSQITSDVAVLIEENVLAPILILVCQVVIFSVVSALISIVLTIVINLVCTVDKLPIIKSANGVLGAVLGLINGVIVVYIISFVLITLSVLIDNSELNNFIASSYIIEMCTNQSFIK